MVDENNISQKIIMQHSLTPIAQAIRIQTSQEPSFSKEIFDGYLIYKAMQERFHTIMTHTSHTLH